jgi:hypothetical protein
VKTQQEENKNLIISSALVKDLKDVKDGAIKVEITSVRELYLCQVPKPLEYISTCIMYFFNTSKLQTFGDALDGSAYFFWI